MLVPMKSSGRCVTIVERLNAPISWQPHPIPVPANPVMFLERFEPSRALAIAALLTVHAVKETIKTSEIRMLSSR